VRHQCEEGIGLTSLSRGVRLKKQRIVGGRPLDLGGKERKAYEGRVWKWGEVGQVPDRKKKERVQQVD